MVQAQGEFNAAISFSKAELEVLIAGFAQRQSGSCSIAVAGYELASRLKEAHAALVEIESNPIAKILAEQDSLDSRTFADVPRPSRSVELPNGTNVPFYASPEGGAMWNGKFDENMPGPNGYTYGFVLVNGISVDGYVCHASGTFRAADETQLALIGQEPELSIEERAELAGVGVYDGTGIGF